MFLLHDRDIHVTCDDSVVRSVGTGTIPLRRSRGYAPFPVRLAREVEPVVAVGGELKATCCVTRDDAAILSQHVGDMANLETLSAFEQIVDHMCTLFRVVPRALVCDLHPGYISTQWAEQRAARDGLPLIRVQHHHAHAAAVMAEHQHPGDSPVIALTYDGTGYGSRRHDLGRRGARGRLRRLRARRAPRADATCRAATHAIRHPARIALAHLHAAGIAWDEDLFPVQACTAAQRRVLAQQCATGFQAVPTTSMGRLFDAAAALLGLSPTASYEGQAAMELEALADTAASPSHRARLRFDIGSGMAVRDRPRAGHARDSSMAFARARRARTSPPRSTTPSRRRASTCAWRCAVSVASQRWPCRVACSRMRGLLLAASAALTRGRLPRADASSRAAERWRAGPGTGRDCDVGTRHRRGRSRSTETVVAAAW